LQAKIMDVDVSGQFAVPVLSYGATMTTTSRVDMHCHSSASQVAKLGVQRAVGLPECATPPEEVYALAKRRGMDFVTITDHDTIAGVLEISDRPDVFISEELTVRFGDSDRAAHVLCYAITPDDHEWLQAHSGDLEACAEYLHEHDITCALAHPYYTVAAPLAREDYRRLAELFEIWETRNGARAPELNRPAATFVATRGGIGIAGSDDHAGVDIGRTWTETPRCDTPAELLERVRRGEAGVAGDQGSAAKWADSAVALALRVLGDRLRGERREAVDPQAVMTMVTRLLREGHARGGLAGEDLSAADACALLRAWLTDMGLEHLDARALLGLMQDERFTHNSLHRHACRVHEQKLRDAMTDILRQIDPQSPARPASGELDDADARADLADVSGRLFSSAVPVVPYVAASTFLANETARLRGGEGGPPKVAVLVDGIGATHGVSRVIEEMRRRGVPGFEVEVVGTDADVDRRLSCVMEATLPYGEDLTVGVPSVAGAVERLAEGSFDLVHVCSPGPVGALGLMIGRGLGLPVVGSYHTELAAYAALRSESAPLTETVSSLLSRFYGACDIVLSPSGSADRSLETLGVPLARLLRWTRGVDTLRFSPALRDRAAFPREAVTVLYAGRLQREKGTDLLAETFLAARREEPRLHLVLAGGGPEEDRLRRRLGDAVTLLGWLRGEELARAYASSDIFLFPSITDTFGQVILEAQASGVPVVAAAAGGPLALIEDGVTGLLRAPRAEALAAGVLELARSSMLSRRLAGNALAAVRERTWERALEQLAIGYRRALAGARHAVRPAERAAEGAPTSETTPATAAHALAGSGSQGPPDLDPGTLGQMVA
jgi:glycosyltransferase involved in cell wall biosynthesis/predicted metal-dependent phosphoesterase TrpH